jgi:hypothetical protein
MDFMGALHERGGDPGAALGAIDVGKDGMLQSMRRMGACNRQQMQNAPASRGVFNRMTAGR